MNHRFELDVPETLTEDEARLVIEVLQEVIDLLYRQVARRKHLSGGCFDELPDPEE